METNRKFRIGKNKDVEVDGGAIAAPQTSLPCDRCKMRNTYGSFCSAEAANSLFCGWELLCRDHGLQHLEGEVPEAVMLLVEQEDEAGGL
jgi:hypothetical protein